MLRWHRIGMAAAVAGVAALSVAASQPAQGAARVGSRAFQGAGVVSPGSGWHIVLATAFKDKSNYFDAVVALSRDDAWAFGGSYNRPYGYPVAEHWNGTSWRQVSLPAGLNGGIIAASATSASDIWTVSLHDVLHWNGTRWSVAGRWKNPYPAHVTGITAISPRDVWLFGGSVPGGVGPGLGAWHYNGHTWTRVRAEYGRNITAASALSADSIWGIGGWPESTDFVDHFNGATWQKVDPPAVATMDEEGAVLATSANDVWVGGVDLEASVATPVLVHRNGTGWHRVAFPGRRLEPLAISPDGGGGLWLFVNGWDTEAHLLMHRSAAGAWSITRLTARESVGSLALVPGTKSLWAVDSKIGPDGTTDAVIWAYTPPQ